MNKLTAIDLFAGCGGLSEGLHQSGFHVVLAIENNPDAVRAYEMNHQDSIVLEKDIREIQESDILEKLNSQPLSLLAGCPPCQGFSSVRRLNKRKNVRDNRNSLINEYFRLVKALKPLTIMMENVPGLINYYLFKRMVRKLRDLGYKLDYGVVNLRDYGVPQRRRRLVLVGSLLGDIKIAAPTKKRVTVRDAIGHLEPVSKTKDPLHKIVAKHKKEISEMIKLLPHDGGSRKDLPEEYILSCHEAENVGFNDVYGRLRWDDVATTITGGCLNPSKGRFLHPKANRAITAREAALLQSFPTNYKFPLNITKTSLALLIGNALPPTFSSIQAQNIKEHLLMHSIVHA
jgi:DNA (cytosine-5)-methyltransferase 1